MNPRHVTVGNVTIGNDLPMVFILGPNTLEIARARSGDERGIEGVGRKAPHPVDL